MLRHYDKIGLLNPNAVLENGYRTYTSHQIETVSAIGLYQSCGFSLTEIKELLSADEAGVQQLAQVKLAEVGVQEKMGQLARERLQNLAKDSPQSYVNHYSISYTQQESQLLFCCTSSVAEVEIEASIEHLYHVLDMLDTEPDGLLMLLTDLDTADTFRISVPVKSPLVYKGYESVTLDAGWYLSTMHHGDYNSIGMAYDRLLRHADEKGYKLKPPFGERYYLDATNAVSPARYITQIIIKFTP